MWVSRQKFTELEEKVNNLDSEKITKKVGDKLNEQDKKIEEFISLSKTNALRIIAGSFDLARRVLGITEKECDRIIKEEKKAIKEDKGAN